MQKIVKKLYKDEISAIVPYEPGKPIEEVKRDLGIARVIKLASNENPLGGVSRKVLKAVHQAVKNVRLYPDGGSFYLKQDLSQALGITRDQLIIGNGSNEIIELLARGFLSPGDRVITSDTTFLVYSLITKICGGELVSVPMKDFRYDLEGILGRIDDRTRLIFIANPNNPTGTYVTNDEAESFLKKIPPRVIVCFDEAYYDFVDARDFPNALFHIKTNKPNMIVLRTFSKSYGLAGLRIGYGMAHPELTGYLNKIRQPFNVNSLAQAAARAVLEDTRFLLKTKQLIQRGRSYLYRQFDQMGLHYLPSQANFILLNVGQDGRQIFEALMKHGVIIRAMYAYGLPSHIRVTIGTDLENRAFVRALKKVLASIR